MSTHPNSERTPLLQQSANGVGVREQTLTGSSQATAVSNTKPQLGPLEISASDRRAILLGIWLATFLSSLNTTLVATLVSSISSEFQASNQASWLGTSYLLATCTFTPLYGRLSNVLGRRGANQTAVFFAGLGTLCCGLSGSLPMLIAARFLSGMGGGGIFTTATVITSDMYSLRDRSIAQGISNIFNGAGMGLGGPFGGFISDRFGWRWAFLIQIPLFVVSFLLTGYNLRYVTPGRSKSTKDVLKRIDYGGSLTLFLSMGSLLFFLSYKYNDELPFTSPSVLTSIVIAIVTFIAFVVLELFIVPEPVLAPFLLKMRVPVLIGMSNLLVSICNFAVMYFFPMFFETVMLTTASEAGTHLLPNSMAMSCGSLFAGYIMSSTGRYKLLDSIFGIGPFVATMLMSQLNENSGVFAQWFSIIPLGFGNAVVLQTTLIALLVNVDQSAMAVATGFGQLWRGIGQVWGVAFASAVFQSLLDDELRKKIVGPGSDDIIRRLRHSSKLVISLPPELQTHARDAYGIALRQVFKYAAVSTLLAFVVRLAIPERSLDDQEVSEDKLKQQDQRQIQNGPGPGQDIDIEQAREEDRMEITESPTAEREDFIPGAGTGPGKASSPISTGLVSSRRSGVVLPRGASGSATTPRKYSRGYSYRSDNMRPFSESFIVDQQQQSQSQSIGGAGAGASASASGTMVRSPGQTQQGLDPQSYSSRSSFSLSRRSSRTLSRRLSFYESTDGGMDLEDDEISGSARR